MAEGKGEYLSALADTMNCQSSARAEFSSTMQKNYSRLVGSGSAVELYNNVKSEVKGNSNLSGVCAI